MKALEDKYPFCKLINTPSKKNAVSLKNIFKKSQIISAIRMNIIPEREARQYDRINKQSKNQNNEIVNLATIDYDRTSQDSTGRVDDGILKKLLFSIKASYSRKIEREAQTRNVKQALASFNLRTKNSHSVSHLKEKPPVLFKDNCAFSRAIQVKSPVNNQTISTIYSERMSNANVYKDYFYPSLNRNCSKIMLRAMESEVASMEMMNAMKKSMKRSQPLLPKSLSEASLKKSKLKKQFKIKGDECQHPSIKQRKVSLLCGKEREMYNRIAMREAFRFFDTIL